MGRRGLFSAMVVAGLTQMAPAVAQVQDEPQDVGAPPAPQEVAAAAPAPTELPAPVSAPDPVEVQATRVSEDGFRASPPPSSPPPAPAVVAQAEPAVPAPAVEPEIDPADRDLAEAPAEEMRPVVIDPATGRPIPASTARGARGKMAHVVPQPKLVAAEPALQAAPVAAAPVAMAARAVVAAAPARDDTRRETQPVMAAADPEPVATAADEPQPVYVAEEHGDEANHVGQRAVAREPAYAAEEHGDEANHVGRPVTDPSDYARAVKAAIPAALNADRGVRAGAPERAAPPVYAQETRIAPPVLAPRDRDPEPAYPTAQRGDDALYADRDGGPAYAQDDRDAARGYEGRYPDESPRYAMQDRDVRPGLGRDPRSGWQWGSRYNDRTCDDGRADQLAQRLRRETQDGIIDRRTAQDIADEIAHAADLQRGYCASGMNDWREERLDRQYAQIEDRIRYEEDDRESR